MLKIAVIVIAVLIAAILLYAASRPDTFRVERSTSIKASPEKVFALINDFHRWEAWSPWEKVDPAVKRSYSGPVNGVGAVYEWNGNKDVGQGRIEIIDSSPPSKLMLKIDFFKPMEAHNRIDFTLAAHGDTTTITQAIYGPNNFVSKLMHIFVNVDKMIGDKFKEGHGSIKIIAEK